MADMKGLAMKCAVCGQKKPDDDRRLCAACLEQCRQPPLVADTTTTDLTDAQQTVTDPPASQAVVLSEMASAATADACGGESTPLTDDRTHADEDQPRLVYGEDPATQPRTEDEEAVSYASPLTRFVTPRRLVALCVLTVLVLVASVLMTWQPWRPRYQPPPIAQPIPFEAEMAGE